MNAADLNASYAMGRGVDDFRECATVGQGMLENHRGGTSAIDLMLEAHSKNYDAMPELSNISEILLGALQKLDPELRTVLEVKYGLAGSNGLHTDKSSSCDTPSNGNGHKPTSNSQELDDSQARDLANQEVAQHLGTTADSVAALEALALRALYCSSRKA